MWLPSIKKSDTLTTFAGTNWLFCSTNTSSPIDTWPAYLKIICNLWNSRYERLKQCSRNFLSNSIAYFNNSIILSNPYIISSSEGIFKFIMKLTLDLFYQSYFVSHKSGGFLKVWWFYSQMLWLTYKSQLHHVSSPEMFSLHCMQLYLPVRLKVPKIY